MSVSDNASPKSTLLRRFSRSSSRAMPGVAPTVEKAPPDAAARTTNTSTASLPLAGTITALTKLKVQLGRRRSKKQKLKFPPSSWNVEQSESGASSDTTVTPEASTQEESKPTIVESSVASPRSGSSGQATERALPEPPNSEMGNHDAEEPMSAATLARRIQSLLSSLPPFYTLAPSGSLRSPKDSSSQGNNAPDAGGPLADSKLLSLLSSASAMNGSISKGRESVWSILERLRYSPNTKSGDSARNESETGVLSSDDDVETSSVMICCPLEPTEDTEVEIARSEIVSIDIEDVGSHADTQQELKVGLSMWPFGKGKSKAEFSSPKPSNLPPKVKEVRIWYPSRTKVSLQAAWWGYRIYLPPPVMRILNDKTLEAAKRAAMITAALSWLVSNIPTAMLPPPLKAVVGIVKGIVPIIGYVGGFIAWSWNTVQNFDNGQGVILSATWLLPIALVPGTWDYSEPPPSNISVDDSESVTIPPTPPPKDPSPPLQPTS